MKLGISFVLAAWSVAAVAVEDPRSLIADIESAREAGLKLHQSFDPNNDAQLAACAERSQPLRVEEALRPRVMSIDSFDLRLPLVRGADAAFACFYCSAGSDSQCGKVESELRTAAEHLTTAAE